jgi:hypothetical protein
MSRTLLNFSGGHSTTFIGSNIAVAGTPQLQSSGRTSNSNSACSIASCFV